MEITSILLLAVLTEGIVEYLFAGGKAEKYLHYIALLVGVILAVAYNVDILRDFAGITSGIPYVGAIVSGVLIGRGSNYVNDILSRFGKK